MWLNCESKVDQVWIVYKFYFSNVTLWDQLWNIFKPEILRLDKSIKQEFTRETNYEKWVGNLPLA